MNADQIIAKYKLDPGLFPSGLKERLACSLIIILEIKRGLRTARLKDN